MEEKSRTEHSARNTTVAMFARAFAILMGFAARVVFTHTLSEDYVGINGLFVDILSVRGSAQPSPTPCTVPSRRRISRSKSP